MGSANDRQVEGNRLVARDNPRFETIDTVDYWGLSAGYRLGERAIHTRNTDTRRGRFCADGPVDRLVDSTEPDCRPGDVRAPFTGFAGDVEVIRHVEERPAGIIEVFEISFRGIDFRSVEPPGFL